MSDLPSLEIVDIDTPDDPSLSGRYVKVDDDLELVIRLIRENRLVDRETLEPCHVRRTLHQTDYPCNRHQHYWIPDDAG